MISLSFLDVDAAGQADLPWPDVYFGPGYGRAVEASDGARWEVAVGEPGPFLYPYLKRVVDPDLIAEAGLGGPLVDLVSPYGYAGIWAPAGTPAAAWRAFREAFRATARERGVVAELLRVGSLLEGQALLHGADAHLELRPHNETIAVELEGGHEAVFARAVPQWRNKVRKAAKGGHTPRTRVVTEADLAPGGAFRRIYDETMERVEARPYYFFPDAYYTALRDGLGDDLRIVEVVDAAGEVVAASLWMRWGELLHYHLAGSHRTAGRTGVMNQMVDAALAWASDAGLARVHLGGGLTADDALFAFKAASGGRRLPFFTGRCVLDSETERALTEARARRAGTSVEALRATGYFPAYRAPLPA
ncbi:MAG: GNAT family N-acetyltransferase [Alphaproteobacteria bacterium]|nr:GNAT family N-acetyltransferase [Alphaproteobacteria bacterium]